MKFTQFTSLLAPFWIKRVGNVYQLDWKFHKTYSAAQRLYHCDRPRRETVVLDANLREQDTRRRQRPLGLLQPQVRLEAVFVGEYNDHDDHNFNHISDDNGGGSVRVRTRRLAALVRGWDVRPEPQHLQRHRRRHGGPRGVPFPRSPWILVRNEMTPNSTGFHRRMSVRCPMRMTLLS